MAMDTDEQADCVASPVSHSACDSRDFRDGSVVGKRLDESRGDASLLSPVLLLVRPMLLRTDPGPELVKPHICTVFTPPVLLLRIDHWT